MADGDERSGGGANLDVAMPVVAGHRIGAIVGWDPQRGAIVEVPGGSGPTLARSIVPLDATSARAAIDGNTSVLLAFDGGDPTLPIIVGLVQPIPASAPAIVAEVDGKPVVIEGSDEIVLRCGLASITLRRNGRIVIRGSYVETRARGVNRIRGGTVQIN